MTKTGMARFKGSELFHEICEIVVAWDYYLNYGDRKESDECMHKWEMAKLAIEYITGKTYCISRNEKRVAIINESDYNDILFETSVVRYKAE